MMMIITVGIDIHLFFYFSTVTLLSRKGMTPSLISEDDYFYSRFHSDVEERSSCRVMAL